jgi:hypothetical protein
MVTGSATSVLTHLSTLRRIPHISLVLITVVASLTAAGGFTHPAPVLADEGGEGTYVRQPPWTANGPRIRPRRRGAWSATTGSPRPLVRPGTSRVAVQGAGRMFVSGAASATPQMWDAHAVRRLYALTNFVVYLS